MKRASSIALWNCRARRVEALLQAHAEPGSFLQERAVTLPAEAPTSAPQPTEAAGMRIGPYKLIELIGEGGMGSVWLTEQLEPVTAGNALCSVLPSASTSMT